MWLEPWFWTLAGTLVVVALGVPLAAWAARGRWGKLVRAPDSGEAGYRSGPTMVRAPSGSVPREVTFGATLAGVWGVLTALVLVPGGVFVSHYLAFDRYGPPWALLAGSCLATLSGVVLVIGLWATAVRLVRRSRGAFELGTAMARYAYVHHGLTFVVYAATIVSTASDALGVTLFLAIPCGIGVAVGAALQRSADALRAAGMPDTAPQPSD